MFYLTPHEDFNIGDPIGVVIWWKSRSRIKAFVDTIWKKFSYLCSRRYNNIGRVSPASGAAVIYGLTARGRQFLGGPLYILVVVWQHPPPLPPDSSPGPYVTGTALRAAAETLNLPQEKYVGNREAISAAWIAHSTARTNTNGRHF